MFYCRKIKIANYIINKHIFPLDENQIPKEIDVKQINITNDDFEEATKTKTLSHYKKQKTFPILK